MIPRLEPHLLRWSGNDAALRGAKGRQNFVAAGTQVSFFSDPAVCICMYGPSCQLGTVHREDGVEPLAKPTMNVADVC